MHPPIFTVCSADAGVTALLGAAPCRLYPFGLAPQNPVKPYAVWQIVTGSPENYINQLPDTDSWTLQVDVYATSTDDARAVVKVLRDAIEPKAHITRWHDESRDPETKNYRFGFDCDWWVNR